MAIHEKRFYRIWLDKLAAHKDNAAELARLQHHDTRTVAAYAARPVETRPPIKLRKTFISDGHHRTCAAMLNKERWILVQVDIEEPPSSWIVPDDVV